jgi:hypothetical protein
MRRYNENRYGASDVARRLSLENCRDRLAAVLRPLEVDIGGIVSRDLYFDVASARGVAALGAEARDLREEVS